MCAEHLALARAVHEEGGPLRIEELRVEPLAADTFQTGPLGGPPRPTSDFADRCAHLVGAHPPKALSLMLPDEWIRLVFAESGELPRQPHARNDILAWKLKRLVPFRVDELRFEGVVAPAVAGQSEPQRLLLAFGVEALLAQLEATFNRLGIQVGRIRNRTLGLLSAARHLQQVEVGLAILVGTSSWSLLATHAGEPVLTRVRPRPSGEEAAGTLIRELRLTRAWLGEALPRRRLERAILVCDRDEREAWASVVEGVFELRAHALEAELDTSSFRLGQAELVSLGGTATEVIP